MEDFDAAVETTLGNCRAGDRGRLQSFLSGLYEPERIINTQPKWDRDSNKALSHCFRTLKEMRNVSKN